MHWRNVDARSHLSSIGSLLKKHVVVDKVVRRLVIERATQGQRSRLTTQLIRQVGLAPFIKFL